MFKPPRVLRLLSQHGANAMLPNFDKGRYIAPMISNRKAAMVRKRAIIEGTFGSFNVQFGGWDPAWDQPRKVFVIKPFRGHIRDRTRSERAEKVTKAMQGMPQRIAKYYQEAVDRKPKKDLAYMFKRVQEMSDGKARRH